MYNCAEVFLIISLSAYFRMKFFSRQNLSVIHIFKYISLNLKLELALYYVMLLNNWARLVIYALGWQKSHADKKCLSGGWHNKVFSDSYLHYIYSHLPGIYNTLFQLFDQFKLLSRSYTLRYLKDIPGKSLISRP